MSIRSEETYWSIARDRGRSTARSGLVAAIEQLLCLTTELSRRRNLLTARTRVGKERFSLVALGELTHVESALINALLGPALLPPRVVPLRSVGTTIGARGRDRLVTHTNGREHEYAVDELPEHVTEASNPGNRLGVELARLELDHALLRAGVELVGTPGIGSVHSRNTQVTHDFLPWVDAGLAADAIRGAVAGRLRAGRWVSSAPTRLRRSSAGANTWPEPSIAGREAATPETKRSFGES